MGVYGTYAVKFKDGTYMNKGHGKATSNKTIHKYITAENALDNNFMRHNEMSVVQINEDGTENLIYSFEYCKKYYLDTIERIRNIIYRSHC